MARRGTMSAGSARGKTLDVLPCTRPLPGGWRKLAVVLPVYAWRAEAYYTVRTARNPLQRSVLRLAGAGVVDQDRIASLLGLHTALARHVQFQCFSAGLLDDRF